MDNPFYKARVDTLPRNPLMRRPATDSRHLALCSVALVLALVLVPGVEVDALAGRRNDGMRVLPLALVPFHRPRHFLPPLRPAPPPRRTLHHHRRLVVLDPVDHKPRHPPVNINRATEQQSSR